MSDLNLCRYFLRVLERKGVSVLCFDFDGTLTVHPQMADQAKNHCKAYSSGDPECEPDYFELSETACNLIKECTLPGVKRWKVFITSHNTATDLRRVLEKHMGKEVYRNMEGIVRGYDGKVHETGKRLHLVHVHRKMVERAAAQNGLQQKRRNKIATVAQEGQPEDHGPPADLVNARGSYQRQHIVLFDDHTSNVDIARADGFQAVRVHESLGLMDDDLRVWICERLGLLSQMEPELASNLYHNLTRLHSRATVVRECNRPDHEYYLVYDPDLHVTFRYEVPLGAVGHHRAPGTAQQLALQPCDGELGARVRQRGTIVAVVSCSPRATTAAAAGQDAPQTATAQPVTGGRFQGAGLAIVHQLARDSGAACAPPAALTESRE